MNDHFQINFSLKGITSILIGTFIFIAGYLIETVLAGDNLPTNLSVKTLIITITVLAFLFSSLSLYFIGKKKANKLQHQLWNVTTKNALKKYVIGFMLIFTSLFILMNQGFIDYITPIFLILYGLLLFIFKNKERKNLLVLAGLSILLAVMCFLIPTYWTSSISILGIAHVAYGVVIKD